MKEWTLMFYFAGDNELASLVVPELKGIKDAGFHENIDVLVHFDANELRVPTRVYDVNRKRKLDRRQRRARNPNLTDSIIGDGTDTFVRNMQEDDIDPGEIEISDDRPVTAAFCKALKEGNEIPADVALANFVGFCRETHPAKRYMLFLLGHGVVVANDEFLPDDNPVSSITLKRLGEILDRFANGPKDGDGNDKGIKGEGSAFELLGLHSCAMSSIEVAYELKGTANYLMASEGPSYIGSFPYRQLLKKIFNHLKKAKDDEIDLDVPELVEKTYFLTLHNGKDFTLAGYSNELALCNLDPDKVKGVSEPIQNLVKILNEGLKKSSDKDGSAATKRGKRIKEMVLLAHWESQSFWGESYTDLFDFCRCLREMCDTDELKDLRDACDGVIKKLDTNNSEKRSERFEPLIIHSENFGSEFPYSHGLSIYFPWSRPVETVSNGNTETGSGEGDEHKVEGILERYRKYAFSTELGDNSWISFLETYFEKTRRRTRDEEEGRAPSPGGSRKGSRNREEL